MIILYLAPLTRRIEEDLTDLLVIPRKLFMFIIVLLIAPSLLEDDDEE